jgi:hypothetical protein
VSAVENLAWLILRWNGNTVSNVQPEIRLLRIMFIVKANVIVAEKVKNILDDIYEEEKNK